MKRIFSFLLCSAAFVSCVEDMNNDQPHVNPEVVTFFETSSEDVEVKSVLSSSHEVLWEIDDQINVFAGAQNKPFIAVKAGKTSSFTGEINTVAEGDYYYALYPYSEDAQCVSGVISTTLPSTQYAVKDSYPRNANITVAKSQDNVLNFKNVCGLFQMPLSTNRIAKIEVSADEGQYFAGDIDITVSNEPQISVRNGVSMLTILPQEGHQYIEAGTYYFPILPQTYTNLMLKFTDVDGKVAVKCSDYPNPVVRSKGLNMQTVDANLGWAAEVKGIFTPDDFIAFAKAVNSDTDNYKALAAWASEDGVVYIHKNLDMKGKSQIIWTYKGILDGNGKTISNYVLSGSSANVALIADNHGTIRNLNLDNTCSFTQTRNNAELYVGSLVGKQQSGAKVINCSSSANVIVNTTNGSTQIRIGGIVGWAVPGAEISGSAFNGTLSVTAPAGGDLVAGGIVGFIDKGATGVKITDCKNSADISLTELQAGKTVRLGGVVGICRAQGTDISECANEGDLTINASGVNSCIGGICGFLDIWADYKDNNALVLSKSENHGTVKLTTSVDNAYDRLVCGIVGKQSLYTKISECTNHGSVINDSKRVAYCGGVVGKSDAWIYKCKNNGLVTVTNVYTTGMAHVGGIVGYLDDTNAQYAKAEDCENYGEVTYSGSSTSSIGVGGVVGRLARGTAEGCTNKGVISSMKSGAGSIVGYMYSPSGTVTCTIKNCKVGGHISIDNGSTKIAVTTDNFSKYIYGGKPSSGVTAVIEGNTFAQ